MEIIIIGTGAMAAELTSYVEDGEWGKQENLKIKGYVVTTDAEAGLETWHRYHLRAPYLGVLRDHKVEEEDCFVIAFDNPQAKRGVVDYVKGQGGKFATLIHPTAMVAKSAMIGEGNILEPFTMVGPNVKLGDFNLFTSQSVISHDCIVGDYNFFATSLLCGHVCVGNDNYFGIRSTVLPHIAIGNGNTIQAGMVVDKNVAEETTVFYRFKEKVMVVR